MKNQSRTRDFRRPARAGCAACPRSGSGSTIAAVRGALEKPPLDPAVAAGPPRSGHGHGPAAVYWFEYVVSSTPGAPRWTNATVVSGDVVAEIEKLTATVDGELLVYASYELSNTLIAHDLVDELRLVVFPVLLGTGTRLIADLATAKPLRLIDTRRIGSG